MKDFFSLRLGIEDGDGIECITHMVCRGMSVGMSDKHPLAQRKEVSIWELRDEVFGFSNAQIENNAMNTLLPRCQELGITPKIRTMDWIGQYVFRLASEGKIILPVSRVGLLYEGIRFVRVIDWDNTVTSVFISLKENHRHELGMLKEYIKRVKAPD